MTGSSSQAEVRPAPSAWFILRVWLSIGLQSFGGGSATLYLIRRAAVEQYGWISDDEYVRNWAICQIAPGINILGLVILIGWRLAGLLGVVLSLIGLLLPSVTITILLTAAYASIQHLALVQAALRGVVPCTIGLGVVLAIGMARSPVAESRREGRMSLLLSGLIIVGSALLVWFAHAPVIAVLWGAGGVCGLAHWCGLAGKTGS